LPPRLRRVHTAPPAPLSRAAASGAKRKNKGKAARLCDHCGDEQDRDLNAAIKSMRTMNLDELTMNLDELQAYIDEVCRADDRLRAARQWEAERRSKETPTVRKSAPDVIRRDVAPAENRDQNALQCTQPVTSPAPSTDEEHWAG
jgi:hypothetical protein